VARQQAIDKAAREQDGREEDEEDEDWTPIVPPVSAAHQDDGEKKGDLSRFLRAVS